MTLLLLACGASAQQILSLSPTSGPVTGGTLVTLTGDGFGSVASVTFGGVPGVIQSIDSSVSPGVLTVLTPALPWASTAATQPVVVILTQSDGDAHVANTLFTYNYSFYVAAVSPSSVPIAGGAEVIIRGAGFTNDATVEFGGTPAASVTFDNATQIRAIAPPHAAGAVNVVVRINGGASSATMSNGISFGPAVVVGAPGPLTRASVGNGVEPTAPAAGAVMSRNGRFVLFTHNANNLVPGDTDGVFDLFLRDLDLQTTEQVNLNQDGSLGPGATNQVLAVGASITPDGRYVAFATREPLIGTDTNNLFDVYVRDRVANTITRASVSSSGSQLTVDVNTASAISADGRYVVFVAPGTGVTSDDTVATDDVFVRDMATNTTVMVSVSTAGIAGSEPSSNPSISDDGRFVAFQSFSTNMGSASVFPFGTNVFLRDRDTDQNGVFDEAPGGVSTVLVSRALTGAAGNGSSGVGKVSPDGSLVLFTSSAFNLVAGDTNLTFDTFLWERQSGAITRISVGPGGVQADRGSQPIGQPFGGGNRYLAFVSAPSSPSLSFTTASCRR